MKVISLDVFGDYGHFRKPYTTSSPLSFGVPPRTAITGILGAIGGFPRKGNNSYHKIFSPDNSKISLILKNPVNKVMLNKNMLMVKNVSKQDTYNLINLGDTPENLQRVRTPFELIKKPRFKIFFTLDNFEKKEEFLNILKEEKSIYTPYLGISELLANYTFNGIFDVKEKKINNKEKIDSIVNTDKSNVSLETKNVYYRENISLVMDNERFVQEYGDVVYSDAIKKGKNGKTIVKDGKYYLIEETGEKITFLTK